MHTHVAHIYTIHITSCQRGDRTGSFLFSFRRKTQRWRPMHTHVAHIYTIHITSCQRGDRTGSFLFSFRRKTQRWRPMHTHVSQIYSIHITSCQREDRVGSSCRRKTQDGDQCTPRFADFHNTNYILPERRQNRMFLFLLLFENPRWRPVPMCCRFTQYTLHFA
jgi:hypothetical protein